MRLYIKSALVPVLIGCAAMPAMAGELAANSHITAVTVYSDRATITREAEIDLPAGASTVVLADLPTSLMANSLRAEGKADSAVTLGALENKVINGSQLAGEKERAFYAQIQQLDDQLDVVKAESQANEARIAFLQKLGDQAEAAVNTDFAHMDLKPEQWAAGSAAIFTGMNDALKIGVAKKIEQRTLNEQIAALNASLNQVKTGQRSTMRVSVPLDAPQATHLVVKVSYQLPNATWRPVYDARVDTKSGKLALTEFGEVRQTTGEDWSNVSLVLSTAEPAVGAAAPRIEAETIDLASSAGSSLKGSSSFVARAKDSYRKNDEMAGASAGESLAAFSAPAPVDAQFQSAQIETGGFVSEYKIPGQANVKADNTASKVMIGTVDNTATLFEQIRPALSAHAFLMARVKIAGDAPLLPGDASLFRDGVFIGSETLPLLRPGEESRVSLGIDDQVAVKQTTILDKQGTSGVISKSQTRERRVVTEIQNLHKTPVDLEVLETVPAPRNEAIKVEIVAEATTPDYKTDIENVTGLNLWKLTVAAGSKADVKLGWRVTWPADQELIWGDQVGVYGGYNRL